MQESTTKTPAEQLLSLIIGQDKLEENYLCLIEKEQIYTILSLVFTDKSLQVDKEVN